MISSTLRKALPLTLLAFSAGCGAEYGDAYDGEPLEETEAGINGGTAVSATTNGQTPYSSVVYYATSTNSLCGAIKIKQSSTRDTYVTAAHCVPGPGITSGWPIRIGNGLDGRRPSGTVVQPRIKEIYRHPSWEIDPTADYDPSFNSYDIAIFTLDRNATDPAIPAAILNIPALPASTDFDSRFISAAETFRLVAYGCNNAADLDGRKQTGLMAGPTQSLGTTAKDKHYFRTTGTPSGCSGDSGSPLMERSSGSNLVSGIVSFAQSGETFYTRVSNVRRWLETPSKLNVIANGELGFLMNHDNLFCLSKGGVASDVLSQVCDGRNQPADNHYWKLVTSGSGFQIQNTQDSTCLQALTDSTLVRRATCSSTSASQRWTFVTSGTGRQIRNSSTGTCITGGSGFATVSTCSSASKPQRWSFFP